MYSIVLMAAVGGSPATPAADQPVARAAVAPVVVAGCNGCAGYAVGCYGSCNGCYGSCHGGGGGFLGHKARRAGHGCAGSACWGSGHGCAGSACWGSCHGYGGACWGSGYGCSGGVYGAYFYPAYAAPPAVAIPVEPAAKPMTKPEGKSGNNGASLKFRLPAGAALFVDGRPTTGTGGERPFFTPPLTPGQRYFYDVRAEVVVAGQTVVEEKRVVVTAGADLVESFPKLFAATGEGTTLAGK